MKKIQPKSVEETLAKLRVILPDLPKRMRQCGDYMSVHHDEVAFSTVAEISHKAGVQPSAMMRFCALLGFGGYSDMQRVFRSEVSRVAPDYSTRLENLRAKGNLNTSRLLAEFVEAGRYSLEKLTHEIDENSLEKAAELLASASLIHIVGYRRAFPISSCLSYTLEKLEMPNIFHDEVGKFSKYNAIRKEDVVVAITFAPYTVGTVELTELALKKGAKVVAITDNQASPVNIDGVCCLKVVDVDVGDFRSLSASINLAMTLAVAAGSKRK